MLDQPPLSFVDINNRNNLSFLYKPAKKRYQSIAPPYGFLKGAHLPPPEDGRTLASKLTL